MTADTTQPAGALPEHPWMPTPIKSSPEEWAARAKVKAKDAAGALPERDIFGVAIDYATQILALMAERDAARASAAEWQKSAEHNLRRRISALGQVNALRRELEELRAQPAIAWDCGEVIVRGRDEIPARLLPPASDPLPLYARPIPPDAREGREPLPASHAEFWLANRAKILDAIAREGLTLVSNRYGFELLRLGRFEAQGGPAGTSADGETQHG